MGALGIEAQPVPPVERLGVPIAGGGPQPESPGQVSLDLIEEQCADTDPLVGRIHEELAKLRLLHVEGREAHDVAFQAGHADKPAGLLEIVVEFGLWRIGELGEPG